MKTITGIPASYGIAIGPAFVYQRVELEIRRETIDDTDVEWARFESAQVTARTQLDEIYLKAEKESGDEHAAIFKAQLMMLDDPELVSAVKTVVFEQKIKVESALADAVENYAGMLEALEDEYLSARALDIRDVGARMLRILLGVSDTPAKDLSLPSIIIADDLTPSDTILLDKTYVLGFCTAKGGATSHTAILARSLGIPAVVGAGNTVQHLRNGIQLIVDGDSGEVIVDPDAPTLSEYHLRQDKSLLIKEKASEVAHQPAITSDGHQVEIVANIGNVEDARAALEAGAEGVGLLRSEFLYLERSSLPTEEEQYQSYKAIADTFGKLPVILRTLDVGGDKEIPYIDLPKEDNPFLGVRAIRLCLNRPQLFKPQLRAALRAGQGNNLKLMFPMVASVEEVVQAKSLLEECRRELEQEGHLIQDKMEVGIMIEIPAAAIIADQLAEVVDFFSIGTNDLSQYTMAADRTNAKVAQIASGFQPAVFRLIKQVIDAAHARGKWVGLCGEMAGELIAIPILLGLGLDEFSMNPPAIPYAKLLIQSISLEKAKAVAELALNQLNSNEIRALVLELIPEVQLG
ncbi:MAG TPA: phosphoenolpyruvate--protein phosphotransferase [Chloroflexi bacterium]|nr:phosphoenolpyruvate--protein phosphotransferase [Chloroflexota bacterium]